MDSMIDEGQREHAFEQAVTDIDAGRGPQSDNLGGLSHLLPEQMPRFREVWSGLSSQQKLALLEALHRREVDTLRLDFNEVYHVAMLDEDPGVRRAAVQSTVEDTSTWLLERLLAILADDPEPELRAAAARGLGPFAQRAELGELASADVERVREALLSTLRRPAETLIVRAAALASLGYFSGDAVRREIAAGFQDEGLLRDAIVAMGHSANSDWLETVLDEFEHPDEAIREVAVTAAGEIGDEEAVGPLVDLIDDPSLDVRLAAIVALGEIGGEEAREALVYALEDKRPAVREAAQRALETLDIYEEPLQF